MDMLLSQSNFAINYHIVISKEKKNTKQEITNTIQVQPLKKDQWSLTYILLYSKDKVSALENFLKKKKTKSERTQTFFGRKQRTYIKLG